MPTEDSLRFRRDATTKAAFEITEADAAKRTEKTARLRAARRAQQRAEDQFDVVALLPSLHQRAVGHGLTFEAASDAVEQALREAIAEVNAGASWKAPRARLEALVDRCASAAGSQRV